jgi:hypothetical protein
MAAPFLLSWLRLATSSSARVGAASPTQIVRNIPYVISESAREHSTTEFLTFPLVAPKPRPANPIFPVIAVHSSCPWSAETDHRAFFCADPWQ